ncbi:dehydrogenase/reductase SDR family member 13-like [Xiphophorus couchianus]|uniref:dehydrogenase/reductase SDR family member 13-like n=1 Tax=Xiphophorus couchianus TaxID=32473 RepID=UPI001016A1F9|nr:dehydrogenase/reductase SDR family member 13-like [Xiphophorus couchianus]
MFVLPQCSSKAATMFYILLVPGLVILAYIFRQVVVIGRSCKSNTKLHGKTVIVTGSNTGIGKTTAIELAKRGARVILACRSKQRGEAALQDVKRESGSNQVVFMQLDLASLQSVRSFAENFLKTEPRLDILVNNAGVLLIGRTEDGFGLMFGVNHLGHFLLTNLLLDRLKECGPSRVVNVSSAAHNWGRVDFDCLNTHRDLRVGTTGLDCFGIYGDSKLCNALFTHELAKRLKGTKVTCYSLHPGSILTELQRNQSTTVQLILKNIERFIFKTPLQGSQTTLHCALQEGIEHLSGRYFSNCTAKNVFAKARDDAASKKLWEISERFCGI